jgi:phenylpropionate dioxygenase-like ring-hydroxylating dioxygenase large terminal subunit
MLTLTDIRARYGLPADAAVFAALTAGETLPAVLYAAPEIHQLEQEKIFARAWQYACHDSELANPGDVVLTKSGDVPIMIVCGRDGELRGFVNVCRHRLHPVATANCNARLLRCSYHGWTYELDGRLKHAPRQAREPGFDCSAISLKPVAVERWDQFVFVNADAAAASLATVTEDIRPRTDELNADLKEYEYRVRYTYEMDCNWKVWAENAIECYHCPTTHRGSFGKTYDAAPDAYHTISWADTLWHESPIKCAPGNLDPAALKGFRFAFLWPSSFFAVDDFIGFVGTVTPLAPERCTAFVDMYVRPGADEQVVGEFLKMWDQVLLEDAEATNRQQIGYRSGQIPAGRLMLNSEHNLQAFMRRTYQALIT